MNNVLKFDQFKRKTFTTRKKACEKCKVAHLKPQTQPEQNLPAEIERLKYDSSRFLKSFLKDSWTKNYENQ